MSTVLAGPNCARYLADFGADVIKVERPGRRQPAQLAWRDPRDGAGFWWKLVNRNKRTIGSTSRTPKTSNGAGSLDDADVLVENFGRARSSAWASAPTSCSPATRAGHHPGVGFGQDGPYAVGRGSRRWPRRCRACRDHRRARRAAAAPADRADRRGHRDRAAFATMVALHRGVGQVVDVSLLETMFQLMGPLASLFA